MKIIYQGQIGVVAGQTQEERAVNSEQSIASLIADIAKSQSAEVAKFLVDENGAVSASLFAALDGNHVLDYTAPVGAASELLLMPPMAGG